MGENDRVGSTSRWSGNIYERLANIEFSSNDTVMQGRITREKILASLAIIEQEVNALAEHNDAQRARRNVEPHEKAIETALGWLNANGFPASLDDGKLIVEGLDGKE